MLTVSYSCIPHGIQLCCIYEYMYFHLALIRYDGVFFISIFVLMNVSSIQFIAFKFDDLLQLKWYCVNEFNFFTQLKHLYLTSQFDSIHLYDPPSNLSLYLWQNVIIFDLKLENPIVIFRIKIVYRFLESMSLGSQYFI